MKTIASLLMMVLVFQGTAEASGLSAFSTDTEPFLRQSAWSPPAPAGKAVEAVGEESVGERIRRIAAHLRFKGHLNSPVEVVKIPPPRDAEIPAYVEYDFRRGVCRFFIGEKAAAKNGFADAFGFRFMVYHELAHCHLFVHPKRSTIFPGISPIANLMLSDYIQLEYLKVFEEEEMQAPGYHTLHESYADAKAIGIMLSEGWPKERVKEIAAMRGTDIGTINDSHHSGGIFGELLAEDWTRWSARGIDRRAREISDRHAAINILSKRGFVDMLELSPFSAELETLVRNTIWNYRYDGHDAETREFVELQKEQAAAADHPVWDAFFRALKRRQTPERATEAFFKDRYKARPNELGGADREIRDAFAKLSR
jgi:hypothetical protein